MNRHDVTSIRTYVDLLARKHGGFEGLRDIIGRQLKPRSARTLESAADTSVTIKAATKALESFERHRAPSDSDLHQLEAIINEEIRPVIDIIGGTYTSTHPLWTQLSTNAGIRGRIENCIESIGRIELPGHPRLPYGGTGFLIGDGLVMTNRHVAEIFADGLGTQALVFKPGATAGINFVREFGRPAGPTFMVRRIVMIHPYWDMAMLAVDGPSSQKALKLSLKDARDIHGHNIAVIGYPAFDPRNPSDVQQNLFNGRYGVKRLQPGELQGGMKTASFQKLVNAATHDCSTLGGNSGSAVIDLETGNVLALHFGGEYHTHNFAVPAFELARDQRVIDTGVLFAGTPRADDTDWGTWWRRADSKEDATTPDGTVSHPAASPPLQPRPSTAINDPSGTLNIEIPLRISISVGASHLTASPTQSATETLEHSGLEAMREPWRDTNYETRQGYDPTFLNTQERSDGLAPMSVPMPTAIDPHVLAKTTTEADVLHYQNFSIRIHAKRRLALVTACNVTREPSLRKPEAGRDYTRKGLSGLDKNDTEQWFVDPRMDSQFQIPDVFFTKDRKAFDKGHIVRREDVAWGTSYDEVRRANGDSYHVTNCSPQVAGFNRSANGEDNWGDLENYVLAQAANERLCVFAGPVLSPDDHMFHGVGQGGARLNARIPSRFWKVVVAQVEDGIAAYGFVLEQDLMDVEFEFAVPEEFLPTMYPLDKISKMTGVSFEDALISADQFTSVRGVELTQRSGMKRTRT